MNEMETQFEEIYFKNKWLYGSGEGSLPEHTRGYVSVLQKFLREHCITTVVDMGCGDWQFSKLIDWSGITYDGFDIVSSVIGENQKRFSSNTVKFHLYSGNPGKLPAADLLIAKDVLQHLSDGAVKAFLRELKRYKYAIITNCVNPDSATVNADIEDGGFRYLDLRLPPFSIEAEELFSFTNQRPIFTRLFSKPRWVKKVLLVQSRTQRRDSESMRT